MLNVGTERPGGAAQGPPSLKTLNKKVQGISALDQIHRYGGGGDKQERASKQHVGIVRIPLDFRKQFFW